MGTPVDAGTGGAPTARRPRGSDNLDELRRAVATGTADTRIHLDRVSQAADRSDSDEVWGALVDLFLLLDSGSAGMRARALFWGRPALSPDQHQLLADHLDTGLRWSTPIHPHPRRSLHWRGVGGRRAVEVLAPPAPQRPDQIEFDPRAALAHLLESGVSPPKPYRPVRTPTGGLPAGATPPAAVRRPDSLADHRVTAALRGRDGRSVPLGQDDRPQGHAGPTLVNSVIGVMNAVSEDRQARALVGAHGRLQVHPDRTVDVGVTEVQLNAWCEPPMRSAELSVRPVDGQARGHRILSWDQLRWDMGSRCAAGLFPVEFDPGLPLVLRAMPNLSTLRRLPGDFTVLGLLREEPMMLEAVRAEGVELRHLASLVGAMDALGVLSCDPAEHLADDTDERPHEGPVAWFERLRTNLGGR
ncbi:MAG: hypothetical protein R2754_18490 [Microthrixaceae bacterium]